MFQYSTYMAILLRCCKLRFIIYLVAKGFMTRILLHLLQNPFEIRNNPYVSIVKLFLKVDLKLRSFSSTP